MLGMVIDIDRASASDPTVVTFRSPLQVREGEGERGRGAGKDGHY